MRTSTLSTALIGFSLVAGGSALSMGLASLGARPGPQSPARQVGVVGPDGRGDPRGCIFDERLASYAAGWPFDLCDCPYPPACDDPINRDAAIPTPATPMKVVRIRVVVFANDDGSDPTSVLGEVEDQIAVLNADFAQHRFYFQHTVDFINSTAARIGAIPATVFAENPGVQCNVYVVATNGSSATGPWEPQALADEGGVLMSEDHFASDLHVLTHEMGHTLGLWHTFHGSQLNIACGVGPCHDCSESVGAANTDLVGDHCSDTPPMLAGGFATCTSPTGIDPCSGRPWGAMPENYMDYAGALLPGCDMLFTPQQSGRMHCWSAEELSAWFSAPGDLNGDGFVNIADPIFLKDYLFGGGAAPNPLCRGDVNGDGGIDIADMIYLLNYLFSQGPAPTDGC